MVEVSAASARDDALALSCDFLREEEYAVKIALYTYIFSRETYI